MAQPVVWYEVMGTNADQLRSFYGETFGWTFGEASADPMSYSEVTVGDGPSVGGIGAVPEGDSGWLTFYIEVPDLQVTLDEVTSRGGTVLMPPTEMPDMPELHLAMFADPAGHRVGLVKKSCPE